MFWLFILAIIMPISLGNCEKTTNLTEITWDHAVNSWKQLNQTLTTEIQMIEADVIIGVLSKASTKTEIVPPVNATADQLAKLQIPIMGHPPSTSSDLSLDAFLSRVIEYNKKNATKPKGIKLDFKTIEAVNQSIPLLKNHWENLKSIPVWINADILKGPVNSKVIPVDANQFFTLVKELGNVTLSIGWTTEWGSMNKTGNYSQAHVDGMIKAIEDNNINNTGHPITFPVRAGIAAQSQVTLKNLYNHVSKTNQVTFTIWSSEKDSVDVKHLQEFILSFGVNKVYVDVPNALKDKMDLSEKSDNSASSLAQFGLLNIIAFAIVVFLRNDLN